MKVYPVAHKSPVNHMDYPRTFLNLLCGKAEESLDAPERRRKTKKRGKRNELQGSNF